MTEFPEGLHGAYLRSELKAQLGPNGLRTALTCGQVVSYSRNVVVDRSRMLDLRTRSAAALLLAGPEAVLTSHTAALLHGCPAADHASVHILLPYSRYLQARSGVAVHHHNYDPADVVESEGLRCLTLAAVISELICRARQSTALACADQALALQPEEQRGEFKGEVAARIDERPDPRGKRQGAFLLQLATGLPESPGESWLLLTVVNGGFPAPDPQHRIRNLSGREVYRLDFAWPELRIGLEYDGHEAHVDRREHDAAREADLRKRGWIIIRADVSDLRDPTRLLRRLRSAFTERGCVL